MPDCHLAHELPIRQFLHPEDAMKTFLLVFCIACFWLMTTLKLSALPALSWWAVTSPLWVPPLLLVGLLICACMVLCGLIVFQKD